MGYLPTFIYVNTLTIKIFVCEVIYVLTIGVSDDEFAESIRENLVELKMKTGKDYQELVKEALEDLYDKWKKVGVS